MTHRLHATLITLLVCAPAWAADLTFKFGAGVDYDSNVFRRENDREDDVLFSLRPGVRLHEDRGQDVRYSLEYDLPVEFAVDHGEELNDVDHVARGSFTYHVNDRVEVFGSNRLLYLRSALRRELVASDDPSASAGSGSVLAIEESRDRVTRNLATLGMRYQFAPRLVGRVIGSLSYFDSSRPDRAENFTASGTADATYVVAPKHQMGLGTRYTHQGFDDREGLRGSQTDIYNAFLSWRWSVSPTLQFEAQAGPSYIETQQDDAQIVRSRVPVPFAVLPAVTLSGVSDSDGNQFNGTVGNGSLLVPSFFAGAAAAGPDNCVNVNGLPVAAGCQFNVVLDSNDAGDFNTIQAIQNFSVPITNVDPRGGDDESLNIFAEVTLTQRWSPTLATALRYLRQEGNASGLGGTVIVDAVSLSNTWSFAERWQMALRGDWTNRESEFDLRQTFDRVVPISAAALPGGDFGVPLAGRCNPAVADDCSSGQSFNSTQQTEIDTRRWSVAVRLSHRLFRNTQVFAQLRYDEQESDGGTLGRSTDFENFLGSVGVTHVFEPIKLW